MDRGRLYRMRFRFLFEQMMLVTTCVSLSREVLSLQDKATNCLTPAEIPLPKGTIFASSAIKSVRPGDIHYKRCSPASTRSYIGWCPAAHDNSPQLQVKLKTTMFVHGIVFQKTWARCPDGAHDVTLDPYLASFDGHYVPADDPQENFVIFALNETALTDGVYEKILKFDEPLLTKSMVLLPRLFYKSPCFRFKLFGCPPEGIQDYM